MSAFNRQFVLFALAALVPAALAPSPAMASASLSVVLCNGQADAPVLRIPLRRAPLRGDDGGCCAKGCHAGCSRKRVGPANDGEFDPPQ